MSMNLGVKAIRPVFTKSGKEYIQEEYYQLWQTPSEITELAIKSKDPIEIYIDWVYSISKYEKEMIYAEDDIFEEREPIGIRNYNYGDFHLTELISWIKEMRDNEYTIEFFEH